ncbi:MAG: 50S ribosomal protein L6 [Candidatus Thermoplasmatota archaeon]|nr:50S ribosomal protein L6 [Candidatus Thermoplasmatota archaeon]
MTKVDTITKEIKIPSNVSMKLSGDLLTVKGPKGELKRSFVHPIVTIKVEGGKVVVHCDKPKRSEMGLSGTWVAHVKNMVRGVTDGFQYKMRIIYSHFPIKTSVKGKELVIENFLGERYPRTAIIQDGVTTKISGDTITLEGMDKEKIGQTAANIEKSTVVKGYDPRVFQDGIYLVSRGE